MIDTLLGIYFLGCCGMLGVYLHAKPWDLQTRPKGMWWRLPLDCAIKYAVVAIYLRQDPVGRVGVIPKTEERWSVECEHEWVGLPIVDMHLWYVCVFCNQREDAITFLQAGYGFKDCENAFIAAKGGRLSQICSDCKEPLDESSIGYQCKKCWDDMMALLRLTMLNMGALGEDSGWLEAVQDGHTVEFDEEPA